MAALDRCRDPEPFASGAELASEVRRGQSELLCEKGWFRSHLAALSTLGSSRMSTTERRSRSTMMVPYRVARRQLQSSMPTTRISEAQ